MYLRLQNIIQRQYFLGPDSRKGLKKWARPGLILRVTICARTCASSSSRNSYFLNPHCQPYWVLLGSPMHMDPRPSQQHAGLQHAVWQLPHEVTNPRQGRGREYLPNCQTNLVIALADTSLHLPYAAVLSGSVNY